VKNKSSQLRDCSQANLEDNRLMRFAECAGPGKKSNVLIAKILGLAGLAVRARKGMPVCAGRSASMTRDLSLMMRKNKVSVPERGAWMVFQIRFASEQQCIGFGVLPERRETCAECSFGFANLPGYEWKWAAYC
jgi:hypothetical protein